MSAVTSSGHIFYIKQFTVYLHVPVLYNQTVSSYILYRFAKPIRYS